MVVASPEPPREGHSGHGAPPRLHRCPSRPDQLWPARWPFEPARLGLGLQVEVSLRDRVVHPSLGFIPNCCIQRSSRTLRLPPIIPESGHEFQMWTVSILWPTSSGACGRRAAPRPHSRPCRGPRTASSAGSARSPWRSRISTLWHSPRRVGQIPAVVSRKVRVPPTSSRRPVPPAGDHGLQSREPPCPMDERDRPAAAASGSLSYGRISRR